MASQAVVSSSIGLASSEGERFMICLESNGKKAEHDVPVRRTQSITLQVLVDRYGSSKFYTSLILDVNIEVATT